MSNLKKQQSVDERTIKLSDLKDLLSNKYKYEMKTEKGHQGVDRRHDGTQGEYTETFKYYKHPGLPEGVFMRETWRSDSYGNNESINSIDFVEGKAKTITVYEPI
jgi:hypothetical protein